MIYLVSINGLAIGFLVEFLFDCFPIYKPRVNINNKIRTTDAINPVFTTLRYHFANPLASPESIITPQILKMLIIIIFFIAVFVKKLMLLSNHG